VRDIKLGIIGCGNMGSAIVEGIIAKGILPSGAISLNDKDIEKAAHLESKTGAVRGDILEVVRTSDYLIVAVKPQDFEDLFKKISSDIKKQTVISLMAGVKMSALIERIGRSVPAARAMPNMAAFIGESITCISFNSSVKNKDEIKDIFSGIGKVLEMEESLMDTVTAVSGSGPAYLFYLAEAMIEAAIDMGLDKKTARDLVAETLYGSSMLLRKEAGAASELIKKVASKGGTTESALKVFDEEALKSIIKRAMLRAKERSEELSRG